jgi:hypothetical protein
MHPTNHYVTITDRDGKQIRGKVVYIQPKEERWREHSGVVHIVTSDWLAPNTYPALYTSPTQSVSGTYSVHTYIGEDDQWRFMGTFDRAQEGEQEGSM